VLACDKPVTFVKKGTVVECDSYLFTQEAELQNRLKLIELETTKKELAIYTQISKNDLIIKQSYEDSIKLYEERLKQARAEERWATLEKYAFFGAGALITAFAFANVQR
jgi:hypothetical protein